MDASMEIGEINVDIENDEKQQKAIVDKIGNEEELNGAKKRTTSQMNGGIKAKSPKMLFRCEICAADSIYHYYGVQSCEGCKQFFRRIIVKQKDFKCWKTQKCSIETGERCRSCRLDKCLLMGMDPKMVNIRKTAQLEKFIELLEKRRLSLIDEHRMGKLQQIRNEMDELEKMNSSRPFAEIIKRASMSPTTQGLHSPASSSAHGASPNLMASPEIAAACSSASILQPIPIPATSTAFQPIPSLSLPNAPPSISFKMLDSLLTMENCLKKIWFSNSDLPNAYIERHPDLDSFLRDNKNLLNQAAQFSANTISSILSPNFILEKAEAHGFHFPEHINSVVKDRFLCIEMAKAMPFFGKLKNEDQIALLRHIIGPVTMFFNAFYSFLMGSGTWTRSNGFVNIALFGQSRLANDNKIMTLSRQMLCDTVEAFKKADIGREEFVLLLAILFSSSTAPNLSPSARELLYDESVRHSKALLDLLQLKHGHICGSQKYAIAIELLTQSFHFDYRMHLLSTYTRVMHAFDDATIFPKLFEKTPLRDP